MNTKIILTLGSSLLLASSLLASPSACCSGEGANSMKERCSTKQNACSTQMEEKRGCKHEKAKGSKHTKNDKIRDNLISMMMKVDLSDAQKAEIREIFQKNRKNRVTPASAFTDTTFDKAAFIKIMKEKKENKVNKEKKLEQKAQMIESVYNVLTTPQKKAFKAMLDAKQAKKHHQKMSCKH